MYDTLMYAKKLEASGLTREEAEAQVQIISEMIVDGVATKHDLNEVRSELKQEIKDLRQEIKNDINLLNLKIESSTLALEQRLTIRMGVMFMTTTTLTVAMMQWLK